MAAKLEVKQTTEFKCFKAFLQERFLLELKK